MKRALSRTMAVLLIALMCISTLAGCGKEAQPAQQPEETKQEETTTQLASQSKESTKEEVQEEQTPQISFEVPEQHYKVGVIVYDNTDLQQQAINKYFTEYLGPAFNVEFIISDAIQDSNGEISFLENCASKGAKGIIAFYNVTDPKIIYDKCKELGMYYILGASNPSPAELEAASGNPFYVGGIGSASGDYSSAYEMTKTFLEGGARKIGVATGGKDFGVKMFIDRYNGVVDAIKDFEAKNPGTKITLDEFGGFPNDAWFASQAKMIASNPDAIIATFAGEFLWHQPLSDAGKAGKIKLGTISSMNPVAAQAFADGSLHFLAAIYPQMTGLNFAALYNYMTGYGDDFKDNGKPIVIDIPMPNIKTADEMNKWMEVINAEVPPYSAEDLKKVCKAFNPNATYKDLYDLCMACKYEDILARRSAK